MQNYPFIHSADLTNPADNLELLCAHDHPSQSVEWLWPGKIPIGKVSMIIGDPGTGKTLLALDIAARASRAAAWPDHKAATAGRATDDDTRQGDKETGRQGDSGDNPSRSLSPCLPVSPSSTLILSATDDFQDTLRPRLDAAGADPRRIFYIPSITDLRHDIAQLRAAVTRAPNVRLIIIDPINAFVGPTDSHFHSVLRRVLEPLAKLAAEKRIAVIAIAHLRKNDGAAIHRAAGSMGFVAAARSVWSLARDEETPGRTLFLPIKNNLTPTTCGLAFTINSSHANGAPTLQWGPAPIDAPNTASRRPEVAELNSARQWLTKALAAGPRSASEVTAEAAQYGIHERTLRRALHAIGGQTENLGILDGWRWSLPKAEGGRGKDEGSTDIHDHNSSSPPSTLPLPPSDSNLPPSTLPLPPSKKPVPSCPLSENNNIHPALWKTTPDARWEATPVADDALDHISPCISHNNHETNTRRQPPPETTGNAILDDILDSLRERTRHRPASFVTKPPARTRGKPPDDLPIANPAHHTVSAATTCRENMLWPLSGRPKMEVAGCASAQEPLCAHGADSGHG